MYLNTHTLCIYIHIQLLIQDAVRGVTEPLITIEDNCYSHKKSQNLEKLSVTVCWLLSMPQCWGTQGTYSPSRISLLRAHVGQIGFFLNFSRKRSPWVWGCHRQFIVRNRRSNRNPQINTILCDLPTSSDMYLLNNNSCIFTLVYSITWLMGTKV